jgi:hypothetical protein
MAVCSLAQNPMPQVLPFPHFPYSQRQTDTTRDSSGKQQYRVLSQATHVYSNTYTLDKLHFPVSLEKCLQNFLRSSVGYVAVS